MHHEFVDTVLVGKDVVKGGQDDSSGGVPSSNTTNKAKMRETGAGGANAGADEKCPVDHKTRELWMQQARAKEQAQEASNKSRPPVPEPSTPQQQPQQPSSWTSWLRLPSFSSPASTETAASTAPPKPRASILDEAREVSSIPRSREAGPSACPQNSEQETGTSESGHWVYPSEKQFFEAMRRKGFTSAQAKDMKTVVPIHNAVNERAWAEILKWEAPYDSKSCGGPKLYSFAGEKGKMTPKARINTLLGYTAPFDRHDWIVDRCGTKVEYVIDFYSGRDTSGGGKVNFYLDVRPKLNTWEGVKMRALKATGLA
ncbi:cytochrome c/c1 heme-lyase [Triangularia verruculosa]|uniref:Holocytochrome c-type synthase n=1 Tax=Triangularia verruculosa TaxID=2587418 RepID=A0AAN7ASR4_9PEZI|nr:cytochrome c/c1 heme-lyase [Triangularia verruculosa]